MQNAIDPKINDGKKQKEKIELYVINPIGEQLQKR